MMKQHSQYYQYGVEEVIKQFRMKLHINTIIFLSLALADLIWILHHGVHGTVALFLQYLFMICILVIHQIVHYSHFPRLTHILMTDCDPYKFYEVLMKLDKYDRVGRGKNTLLFYKAACCSYMQERTEEGLSYLKSVNFKKKVLDREANVLLLFANYSKRKNDRTSFDLIKRDLENLPNIIAYKEIQKKNYDNTYKMFRVIESIWNEEDETARKLINELLAENPTVLNQVIFNMYLARLDIKENEKMNAKMHLEYVITHGNKMAIVEEAKELLEKLA